MAPRPSRLGISRSIVTTSGWSWCTLRTASRPSRAVPTTRNSPEAPSRSATTWRMSALSSTTSTLGRSDTALPLPHQPHRQRAVRDVEPDGPARGAAHVFGHDGDVGGAQRGARGHHVALAHLDRAGGYELYEHAGAAGELGHQTTAIAAPRQQVLDEERDGGLGELPGLGLVPRQ